MAKQRVNPNRMELTNLKQKLATAVRGHKLLKDKQDELMRQFLVLVRVNYALREEVEAAISSSAKDFALARAGMNDAILETALLAPGQRITVEANIRRVMSVPLPVLKFHTRSRETKNVYPYGLAFTSSDLDNAVENVTNVLPKMLELAEVEKSCQLMSAEIERTRRRVNALEHVMIPETEEQIRYITMKLDENERSSQVRLMKVKDMILEKTYGYQDKIYEETDRLLAES